MPVSNFPTTARPTAWNRNWLDGSDDWRRAFQDYQIYNMFVDAVNERIKVAAAIDGIGYTPFPHATTGDVCNGNSGTNNTGWLKLQNAISNMSFVVNGWSSPTVAKTYYQGGTWRLGVDDIQPISFYATDRKPREILSLAAAGVNGQLARLVGSSAFNGTNTGQIFLRTGGTWVYSPTNGLPDVVITPPQSNPGAFGTTVYGPDAGPTSGSYVTANFLQELRDKINMTTVFLVGQHPTGTSGASYSLASNIYYIGHATAGSSAGALSGAQANYHTPPDIFGADNGFDAVAPNNAGATINFYNNSPGVWTAEVRCNSAVMQLNNVPTAGTYSLEAHFFTCAEAANVFNAVGGLAVTGTFNAFGDPVVDSSTSDGFSVPYLMNHFHATGLLGSNTTNYTVPARLADHPDATGFVVTPPGSVSNPPFPETFGWWNGEGHAYGNPHTMPASFVIVDYGGVGGFQYVKGRGFKMPNVGGQLVFNGI